jgi:hypothetical protein
MPTRDRRLRLTFRHYSPRKTGHVFNPYAGGPETWNGSHFWQQRRLIQLQLEPLCCFCLQKGLTRPACVADHVRPWRNEIGVERQWEAFRTGPLQSLCLECHNETKAIIEGRRKFRPVIGLDGWPVPSQELPRNKDGTGLEIDGDD